MAWLPGWDSIESAGAWSHFWFWFGIVCLFALSASEVVSHVYSLRKDQLITAKQAEDADEQHKADEQRAAEVANLQAQLSEAGKKLGGLQRRVSVDARAALVSALRPFAGQKVNIWVSTNAWDGATFATDFQSLFREAGWVTPDSINYGIDAGADAVGVEVLVNNAILHGDPNKTPPSGVTLITNLVRLGIMKELTVGQMPEIPMDTILLRIGRIPPP